MLTHYRKENRKIAMGLLSFHKKLTDKSNLLKESNTYETEEGYEFSYNEDYLKREDAVSVSLTLPLQKEAYKATVLFPFFDGLIPEGWLLGVVSRNWKINQNDRFGLLLSVCRDCIGDVNIRNGEEE